MNKKVLVLRNLRLMALAVSVLTAVLAVAIAPASSGKPIFVGREPVDVDPYVLVSCTDPYAFDVWFSMEGFVVWHEFEDRVIANWRVVVTYQNSETGKSLSGPSCGGSKYVGDIETTCGVLFRAKTPEGELVLDAGKIVIDWSDLGGPIGGLVIEAHGPKALSDQYVVDQLCSLLA